MLSRTAADLYWLARYMERAESSARLVQTAMRTEELGLSDPRLHAIPFLCDGTLQPEELTDEWNREPGEIHQAYCMDEGYAQSIWNSLRLARDNGKAVRSRITPEVWEALNQTWLELPGWRTSQRPADDYYEWVRHRSFLFLGAVQATMPRTLARSFLRLGIFMERADQTIRVLQAYEALVHQGLLTELQHGSLLLRSVSSHEAFQEVLGEVPEGQRVLQMLLFHPSIPRSLGYCVGRICTMLDDLGGPRSRTPRKVGMTLLTDVRHDDMAGVLEEGLTSYLNRQSLRIQCLGDAIHGSFLEPA